MNTQEQLLEMIQAAEAPETKERNLRDWFAGMALANIGSNYAARGYIGLEAKEHADQIAAHAYNIADAMLAARKEDS